MGAKLKSKTHLQNKFFDFLSRFLRIWLQSLQKVQILPTKNFFDKKKNINKRRISRWFQILWKSCKKMHQKKVTSKTSLTNMSKSEKSAYLRHIFANNFFGCIFSKLFQWIRNQREILRFFITIWIFTKKIFFALISTFCTLWLQMRRKRLKKTENLFLWMCLRILIGNHQRVCITKLLKSLYPSVGSFYCLNTLRTEAIVNNLQLPSPPRVSISLAGQNLARGSFSSLSSSLWWIGYMLVLL